MATRRQMERYVETLDPFVQKNVEIVTPDDIGKGDLLHFSIDSNIRCFTPSVSRRTANDEDRSVPRISTAPTLAGTILGYQALEYDYDDQREKKGFRGGWYLYTLPFEYALRPNKEILYDADATDEIWLVPFTPEQWEVKPSRVGKFFLDELTIKHQGKERSVSAKFVLEITSVTPISLSPKVTVEKGYWSFRLKNFNPGWTIGEVEVEELTELSKKAYRSLKKLDADMLAHPSTMW